VRAQQLDDRGGVLERVGDDRAGVERGGGQQPALGLGDEQLAGRDASRVERGEALERREVRRGGVADGQRRVLGDAVQRRAWGRAAAGFGELANIAAGVGDAGLGEDA
jgi:hypothetical protein